MARILLTERAYDEAIELCRQVLQRRADAIEAFRIMAAAYEARGNTPDGRSSSRARGLKVDKEDREAPLPLGTDSPRPRQPRRRRRQAQGRGAHRSNWLKVRAQLAENLHEVPRFRQRRAAVRGDLEGGAAKTSRRKSPWRWPTKASAANEQAEKIYQGILAKAPDNLDALWNVAVLYHRT